MPRKSTPAATVPSESEFWSWAAHAEIPTKDRGLIKMNRPWETQREIVRQVFTGLRNGVHQFLITKAGQVAGTTTASLLVAYFAMKCEGIQGVVVANEDDVREKVRQDVLAITSTVDNSRPIIIDNAKVAEWDNRARLMFMTAGPQTGGRVSVGRGYALCLGTEVPLWKNPKAMTILRTRFSSDHPYRLAIFEGTARGKNWWWEVWQEAEGAPGIARIEILWWMHTGYALKEKSTEFRHYWDGRLTTREKRWSKEIEKRYQREIPPTQWAWRRKYVTEQAGGDDDTADQEMPSLIEDAFEATGISFLRENAIKNVRRAVAAAPTPARYRYDWGARLEETILRKTVPDHAKLSVWEPPQPVAAYVIAAVPGYSLTAKCPDWIIGAWKATRDSLEEVAEFADGEDCGMQWYAWACKHLQAAYQTPRRAFILETLGMGMGVLNELRSLDSHGWGTHMRAEVLKLGGSPRNYYWRRPDTTTAGASLQMRASPDIVSWVMKRLQDQIASGAVLVRSKALLAEIERVRQDGDEFIAEGREPANHRVWMAALAVHAWSQQIVPLFQRVQGTSKATTVIERTMEEFFNGLRGKRTVTA